MLPATTDSSSLSLTHESALCENQASSSAPCASACKPSRYNVLVDDGKQLLLFNTRTVALARIAADKKNRVQQWLANPNEKSEDASAEKLRQALLQGQFLIDAQLDEEATLKIQHRLSRFGSSALELVIASTLCCNFRCSYCYVDLNAHSMSHDTIARVQKFFERKYTPASPVSIVFTGGDPSLSMDAVEALSSHFARHCRQHNSAYGVVLITNGYLLDEAMLDALARAEIHEVQISLDGDREAHNRTRSLVGGRSTYESILDNIERASQSIHCHLRINVDRRNHDSIPRLLDDLAERHLDGKVSVYFAQLDDVNENSAAHAPYVLSARDYAVLEPALVRHAATRGFERSNEPLRRAVSQFCGANARNAFVIDPDGNLLKCYQDLGSAQNKAIGKIGADGEEEIDAPQRLMQWLNWDPFEVEACRNCRVLPLCMGGCVHKIVNGGMDVDKGCQKLRWNLEESLRLYAQTRGILNHAESRRE